MKYNLTKEGVEKWNSYKNNTIKIYQDTLFEVEHWYDGVAKIIMCDVECSPFIMEEEYLVPYKEPESPKQKKPILIDDNGGIYLNKEAQEQLDRIENKLDSIVSYLGGVSCGSEDKNA